MDSFAQEKVEKATQYIFLKERKYINCSDREGDVVAPVDTNAKQERQDARIVKQNMQEVKKCSCVRWFCFGKRSVLDEIKKRAASDDQNLMKYMIGILKNPASSSFQELEKEFDTISTYFTEIDKYDVFEKAISDKQVKEAVENYFKNASNKENFLKQIDGKASSEDILKIQPLLFTILACHNINILNL